ncbi:hypothetical protein UA08_08435 [Talaromyces atroroseus]|uniref:Uncharacterized protein n=1 Tax=Talaromyces atroroseus TaxID=1441469 RepID=A0A1Q5Q7W8_TALAT|nr:hypothetical protein UA08_08435 [Talaromyces atroroseus]OKL56307.1 hypothetical protein UA08_08435 [Talaromyces atroroseus]
MQGLWSRATARLPSSSCRCHACLRTYVNGVASRPTSTNRRGLRVANAVTTLYSSIFAGAAIADAIAKRKRRQEWDDKIAAVKEEVNELVDEERRLLEVLSIRELRHTGSTVATQTRLYSTSSRPIRAARGLRESHSLVSPAKDMVDDSNTAGKEGPSNDVPINPEITTPAEDAEIDASPAQATESTLKDVNDEEVENIEYDSMDNFADINNVIPRPEPDFIWERSSITRIKAIQKLAVQQLVYRLLVRPAIVHDYSGLPVDYQMDDALNRTPSNLLRRLQAVRRRLYSLKYIKDSPYDDLMQNLGIEEVDVMRRYVRERYDAFLKQDIQQYLSGKLSLQKLLMQVADNLLSCEEPDRPFAFALLISAFSRTHQNDLADLVLKCLIPNLFQLSTPLIIDIITHFRKTKNLKDFDLFLQMLRGEGGYHVNLRKTWQKKTVNGITITVPPMSSFNPIILTSVITATLRFDQPEKAEAYMHVARANGFVDNFATLSAFLRFYSVRKHYKSGLSTLSRALTFIVSSSDLEESRIARLILYMADFCACCGRDDLFSTLVHAAVQSGFDCNHAQRPGASTSYLAASYRRWRQTQEKLAIEGPEQQQEERPLSEKCATFVALTGERISQLQREAHGVNSTVSTTHLYHELQDAHRRLTHAGLQQADFDNSNSKRPHTSSDQPDSSELKSLRSQLEVLYLRIEQLSSSNSGPVVAKNETQERELNASSTS